MPSIAELIAAGRTWSLEFFPPRDPEAEARFRASLGDFAALGPSFTSVTYGALGSTRERTRDLVVGMNADFGFPTMPHLTCIGHTRAEAVSYTHLRAHETDSYLVCRLLLEKKKNKTNHI